MNKTLISVVCILFFVSVGLAQANSSKKCETSVSGEIGAYSGYFGDDVAELYDHRSVLQGWVEYEKCGWFVNTWASLSPHKAPHDGNELEFNAGKNIKFTDKTSAHTEASIYFIPGARIYQANLSITHGGLTNSTRIYKTSDPKNVPGGITNKTSYDFKKEIGKISATVSPGFSVDNNIFGYGPRTAVGFGYLQGRLEKETSKHTSLFLVAGASHHIFGETDRTGFRAYVGVGISFR